MMGHGVQWSACGMGSGWDRKADIILNMGKEKKRLDVLIVERGMVSSREIAQSYIRQGFIAVEGKVLTKPGTRIKEDARIELIGTPPKWVSRGGDKLEGFLQSHPIGIEGKICLDIGASTGGFTDVLLANGAQKVYAVDVGRGQLHPKLRSDPRVVVMEKVHARSLTDRMIPEPVELVVIDVSFISLTRILPVLTRLRFKGECLTLVKPQFEVGPKHVGKKGVVRKPELWKQALSRILECAVEHGFEPVYIEPSVLKGKEGNQEFFVLFQYPAQGGEPEHLEALIQEALRKVFKETSAKNRELEIQKMRRPK